ncbi:MAG: 6-pyruvoyl-tetrahydropterin synthase-related protein [Candidatus Nanoarchaeia archaeon]|nr:6-pyruvoyl-tetrahydropterin synthase-related protein [Candidatus Nanoarchaeia archaeon]
MNLKKCILIASGIFLIIFLIKNIILINSLVRFPLYHLGDLSNHMSELFFLTNYGYHSLVPNWFNGFILLESYAPLFFFMLSPVYLILKSYTSTMVIGLILIYALGFAAVLFLSKTQKLGNTIPLFLLIFANPLMINNITNIGRFPETIAIVFMMFFIGLILYYKNKEIDIKFMILFIIIYSLIILAHPYVTLITSIIIIPSFFLIKNLKDKIKLIVLAIISLLITSFSWKPFLNILGKPLKELNPLTELLSIKSIISFNTIILIAFLVIFFIYWNKNKSRKDLIFYSIPTIISILLLTRIAVIIPLLNKIPPNTFNIFYLVITLILFFKIKEFKIKNLEFNKYIGIILILIALVSIPLVYLQHEQSYSKDNPELNKEIIQLYPLIDDRFIILSKTLEHDNLLAYGVINYNLTTPSGSYHPAARKEILEQGLIEDTQYFKKAFDFNCEKTKQLMNKWDIIYILSHGEHCTFLKECNFKEIKTMNEACLYKNERNN